MNCECLSHDGFLTGRGLRLVSDVGHSELAHWSDMCYLDRVGSVSASTGPSVHWPAVAYLDQQHRRFLNGS